MITTPQKLHRWASATGFVLAQGTHQAEKQQEKQIKQCSDQEHNLQTDIMHRHHAKRVFLVKSFFPSFLFFFIWFAMVPRPEVRYLWYPCGSLGGSCNSWQSTWGPYSFVLLTRNTRLGWCLCMMSVCKFCSWSLHSIIWFSRCFSAWWVPWARTKPVADTHQCNSCGIVIIDLLVDRRCFFSFVTNMSLWNLSIYRKSLIFLISKFTTFNFTFPNDFFDMKY